MSWNHSFSSPTHTCPMPGCERQLGILASIALSLETEIIAALRCSQWVSPTGILQSVSNVAIPHSHPPELRLCGWVFSYNSPTWALSKNQTGKTCNREPLYKCGGCIEYHETNHFRMAKVTIEDHLATTSKLASPWTVFPWAAILKTACCCFPHGFLCLEQGLYTEGISSWISLSAFHKNKYFFYIWKPFHEI